MSRSEVEYQMRGNLEYSENSSSKFKHTRWVLLQGNVLYLYKKREDAAAIQTVPIPGYQVCYTVGLLSRYLCVITSKNEKYYNSIPFSLIPSQRLCSS